MTLGDLLAVDMQRLMRRHQSTIGWLDLLQPVLERNTARAERSDRFERHEAVPGQPQAVPVPPLVRDQLRSVVGPGVDLARIHTDDRSDAYARSHHADAVTTGRDIYFRSGSFAPHSPAGLGLLAHELTHVAESERPGADWTRDGTEHLARAIEQRVARSAVSPVAAQAYPPPAAPAAPMAPTPELPVTPQNTQAVPGLPNPGANHLRPMHADTDRPPATDPPRSMAPAEPNLDRLKQTLYRDIMSRIRVEFERGA
jgi:Domain of unknown function (DUF4157)